MTRAHAQSGFTLVELVVAIVISAIIMVFVAMFMAAPLDAYQATSRHAALVAAPSDAWPRLQRDLRSALPNSVRWTRNGAFVALEMLPVVDEARYLTTPGASFDIAGTSGALGAVLHDVPMPFDSATAGAPYYLSVDARVDPYTTPGVMTSGAATIDIAPIVPPVPGEARVTVTPAPVPPLVAGSPRRRVFLVTGPVTYLCDETLGTLSRYENYPIAANQAAWDAPADFSSAGRSAELIARGLTTCNFSVSPISATTSQTVAVTLTSTAANGDSVTLLHTSRAELVP